MSEIFIDPTTGLPTARVKSFNAAGAVVSPATEETLLLIKGFVDNIETLLTAIDGRVDGLETLIGTTNTALTVLLSQTDNVEGSLSSILTAVATQTTLAASLAILTDVWLDAANALRSIPTNSSGTELFTTANQGHIIQDKVVRVLAGSLTTPLTGAEVVYSEWFNITGYSFLRGHAYSDVAGTYSVEVSEDDTHVVFETFAGVAVAATTAKSIGDNCLSKWARYKYTNGATPQTVFRFYVYAGLA